MYIYSSEIELEWIPLNDYTILILHSTDSGFKKRYIRFEYFRFVCWFIQKIIRIIPLFQLEGHSCR